MFSFAGKKIRFKSPGNDALEDSLGFGDEILGSRNHVRCISIAMRYVRRPGNGSHVSLEPSPRPAKISGPARGSNHSLTDDTLKPRLRSRQPHLFKRQAPAHARDPVVDGWNNSEPGSLYAPPLADCHELGCRTPPRKCVQTALVPPAGHCASEFGLAPRSCSKLGGNRGLRFVLWDTQYHVLFSTLGEIRVRF